MVTINLQYLSIIPTLFGLKWAYNALFCAYHMNDVDAGWIYRGQALENCSWAASAAILSLLIWFAFRTTK